MVFQKHAQTAQTSLSLIGGNNVLFFFTFSDFLDATATGGAAAVRQKRNGP